MQTPFFPAWRAHLAALGRRSAHNLRQSTLAQLSQRLAGVIPPHLLRAPPAGDHSRERIYSLRLTCECFIWQMLNPQTACREVVRQVQALARLEGCRAVAEGTSAYVQSRQRLPLQRLKQVFQATASATERRAGRSRMPRAQPGKHLADQRRQRCCRRAGPAYGQGKTCARRLPVAGGREREDRAGGRGERSFRRSVCRSRSRGRE